MANMVQLPFNRQYENFRRMPAYPAGGQVPQGLTRGPAIQSAGQSTVVINSMHQFTYANGDFLSMFVGATTNEPKSWIFLPSFMQRALKFSYLVGPDDGHWEGYVGEPGGGTLVTDQLDPTSAFATGRTLARESTKLRDVGFHEICKTDFYLDQN
ncbi:hypothetical protein B0H14DRAFT_2586345 [Mycena olivaceomarginata]|nr:hypothetical protein B0H14DRAFT_2586345 [Mycena olivaceomarginata]